ncbi:hypothetical protein [Paenibacillus sp. FSL W7-1287]|uniref:hypothetical protein n=1 Tax=Paenibacillus sp. FSL W7-1287 TaxID=2954538 RepID=UPI0030F94782
MIKTVRLVGCFVMCIVLSASLFLSSIEAKSFLAEEDTVANVQPFMLFEPFGILNPTIIIWMMVLIVWNNFLRKPKQE